MSPFLILGLCANVVLAGATAPGPAPAGAPRPDFATYKADQADAAAKAKAESDRDAKMAAVKKVIELLSTLQAKVMEEGEKEAKTYEKFACFCKETTIEKTGEIKDGQDEQARLTALIGKLSGERDGKDDDIDSLQKNIRKEEKEKKANAKQFAADKKAYERDLADLEAALFGLEGAIKELKASKISFVQMKSLVEKVRPALALADAMGIGGAATNKVIAMFLQQQPDVPMENYKFHSDDIIATLEKLLDDFRAEKTTLSDEFLKKTVKDHEAYQQLKHDTITALNTDLGEAQKERGVLIEQIEAANAELTTVSAELLDDQQYLKSLAKMCSDTAKTYDQRTQLRQDELSALTATTSILSGSVKGNTTANTVRFIQQTATVKRADAIAQSVNSMESLESLAEAADAAAGAPSFLQEVQQRLRGAVQQHVEAPHDGRQFVAEFLENQGRALKSTALVSLSNAIKADVFAKVKILIQELIERLQHEAARDADQKGWCTKATADAEQKRTYANEEVEDLNAQMAELEANRDKLAEDLATVAQEIASLKRMRKQAETDRAEEKAENDETVATAQSGLDAVNMAIDIMNKFYKASAKATVDLSLLGGPADDAPDAGFGIGEAYTGAQGDQGGIVGMMEVIKSDFERSIKETEHAEALAVKDFRNFMTKTGASLAEKEVVETEKKKYKTDTENKLSDADSSLKSELNILYISIKELMELKKSCVDTGMSYEERVARRENEIAALNKADCILSAYAKYGPDGAGEQC